MSTIGFVRPRRATVGLFDVPRVLLAPRRVFSRVEDVPAYGWSLVVLLAAVTLLGYATVETGLIDREVGRRVEQGIADLEKQQFDVVERSALSKMIEEKREEGEFLRLMARVQHVVARPVWTLASVLLLSSLFYVLVALGGKKPEWHTLITIGVFASFVDVVGGAVRLAFMLHFRTLTADTSLAPLARLMLPDGEASASAVLSGALSAVDPFRIWFWVVVAVGLTVTSQLRGWKAWLSCTLCWLGAAGVRVGLAVAVAAVAGGGVSV
jgi:hypothetical protein